MCVHQKIACCMLVEVDDYPTCNAPPPPRSMGSSFINPLPFPQSAKVRTNNGCAFFDPLKGRFKGRRGKPESLFGGPLHVGSPARLRNQALANWFSPRLRWIVPKSAVATVATVATPWRGNMQQLSAIEQTERSTLRNQRQVFGSKLF